MKTITILLIILIASILILASVLYFSKPTNLQYQENYTVLFNTSKMIGTSGVVLIVNNKSYTYSELPANVEFSNGSLLLYMFEPQVSNSSGFYHLTSIRGYGEMPSYIISATYNFTPINYELQLNITLLPKNQILFLYPGEARAIPIPKPENISINITGSFISNNKIDLAILNMSEYQSLLENRTKISTSRFYYANTQNATINTTLQEQSLYFLVFYNPSANTLANVTITNPIVVK